jgi:hypothetical protein
MMNFFSELMKNRELIALQHQFDKAASLPIVLFEVLIIIGTTALLWILSRHEKKVLLRYFIIVLGIFIFEFFTSPMWNNYKLGAWAYVYQDVSWILTAGWATLVLWVTVFVDNAFPKWHESKRFGLYLAILTVVVVIFEYVVVSLGIRTYSPEVQEVTFGYFPFGVPVAILYYVPVFMSLVIGFYKYWSFMIFEKPIVPLKKIRWVKSFVVSVAGVFLFELMIEPMVVNAKFPAWSYVYRDVSILMTGGWIILVWLAMNFIDKVMIHLDLFKKFIGYLTVIFLVALPVESYLITNGFRIYGPGTTAAFSGFKMPLFNIPVEVAFGIPFYFALIISFIKYWEIILEEK